MKIGEAYVELRADSTQLMAGFGKAESLTKASVARLAQYGKFAAVAAVGMFARSAVREAIAFEQQMANVSTMVDNTNKHMGHLTEGVRQLSMRYGEATETLSRGLYDILSASIGASQAIRVLEVSARSAVGGITSTAVAADAITTVLNSYQMHARRATNVSDILFSTVKRGKITFEQLAGTIGGVASTASAAGVSLEEVSAYIATVTRGGLNAFQAITSLQAILLALLQPSESAAKAAAALGIEFNAETLRTKGLLHVIRQLHGMRAEEIVSVFENKRAIKGLMIAVQDIEGATRDYEAALDSAGAAEEAFAKNADTAHHRLGKLKQMTVDTGREFGSFAMDFAEFSANVFAPLFEGMSALGGLMMGLPHGELWLPQVDYSELREDRQKPTRVKATGGPENQAEYMEWMEGRRRLETDMAALLSRIHNETDSATKQELAAQWELYDAALKANKAAVRGYEDERAAIQKRNDALQKAFDLRAGEEKMVSTMIALGERLAAIAQAAPAGIAGLFGGGGTGGASAMRGIQEEQARTHRLQEEFAEAGMVMEDIRYAKAIEHYWAEYGKVKNMTSAVEELYNTWQLSIEDTHTLEMEKLKERRIKETIDRDFAWEDEAEQWAEAKKVGFRMAGFYEGMGKGGKAGRPPEDETAINTKTTADRMLGVLTHLKSIDKGIADAMMGNWGEG